MQLDREVSSNGTRQISADLLPVVPSDFFACHHFPCLSTISRISPLEKEISFGSSGEAESSQANYEHVAHTEDE